MVFAEGFSSSAKFEYFLCLLLTLIVPQLDYIYLPMSDTSRADSHLEQRTRVRLQSPGLTPHGFLQDRRPRILSLNSSRLDSIPIYSLSFAVFPVLSSSSQHSSICFVPFFLRTTPEHLNLPWYGNDQNPIAVHVFRLARSDPGVRAGKACRIIIQTKADPQVNSETKADKES